MFVPGNNPGMMQDAFIYGPDSIMLDLEDSVTMAEKDAARLLVYNALKSIDYGDTEMVVRINPLSTPYGHKDVEAVVKAGVQVIRMPKTETADEVRELEAEIEKVEKELGCLGRTRMMAAIESAEGICNAFAIAKASKRMMGIALGAEDYCANLKTQRTPGGAELLYARETIVVAARAAGIDALDTVYSNLDDMETFRKEVELIKTLGFDGKSIINPRQIQIVNDHGEHPRRFAGVVQRGWTTTPICRRRTHWRRLSVRQGRTGWISFASASTGRAAAPPAPPRFWSISTAPVSPSLPTTAITPTKWCITRSWTH